MERSIATLGVVACLAIAGVGCGSSSSSNSTSSTAASGATSDSATVTSGSTTTAPTTSTSTSSTGGSSSSGSSGGQTNANGAPLGSNTSKAGDNSIQTYGSEAGGSDKTAVVDAMRSFFRALAAPDYAKVCAGVTSQNRAALAQFAKLKHQQGQGCTAILPTLLSSQTSAASKAANGTVVHVRIGGGNAFVLFRPAGNGPLSYFVMKQENGVWKSTSLATGTPLNPAVPPAQ